MVHHIPDQWQKKVSKVNGVVDRACIRLYFSFFRFLFPVKTAYLHWEFSDRVHLRLKNPTRVDTSVTGLFDDTSKWHFEKAGPGMQQLRPGFSVYIDDECSDLDGRLAGLGLNKYIWYFLQRLLGGEAGVRRLASIKEMEMHAEEQDEIKQPNKFCERILGKELFSAVECKFFCKPDGAPFWNATL